MLSEQQMNEYKKFYDFAFELFNSPSQISSMTTFTTNFTTQFPFYKHYYDDSASNLKNQTSSGTFYKNKRVIVKDKNSTSKITTITTQKFTREEIVGGSQGRRISSAKPHSANAIKPMIRKQKNDASDKLSIKASSTRN